MKNFNVFMVMLVVALNARAADVLTEKLQRGLFEEEANHNLEAAIKEYQSVVAQSDEQRKVIATALFRLGECYRKLGRTNEASAHYQRILRDFSEQEQLVKLANDLVKPSVSVPGQPSELIRELQRRIANLRVQSISGQMEADRLRAMTRQDLLNSDVTKGDSRLASLRATALELEQKAAALKVQFADEHPDVKTVAAQQEVVAAQIDEALKGIIVNAQGRAASLAEQLKALDVALKNAEAELSGPKAAVPSWKTVSDPAQVRLLQEEINLAEQQVMAAERSHANGTAPLASVLNAKRDVLAVRRLLPENSSLPRQRSLLNEQVKIVEQLLKETEERVKVGVVPTTEPIPLRRELLTLQREMAALTDTSTTGSGAAPAQPGLTQAEAEALARAKTLARNSPDLLQSPTRDGLGEMQLGARDGFYSVVEFILAQGVSANGPERGTPPIVLAAMRGHLRIVQLLLDKGADVNAGSGNTALMSACDSGYRAVVELLLQRNADVNRNADGTALHKVAAKGYTGLAELLLQHGAEPDAVRGSTGDTPLHYAMSYSDVAEALLKAGASATVSNSAGVTPLHLAASRGTTNVAMRLLDNGANPNAKDSEGRTPLYNAQEQARSAAMVRLLLARGADVNRRDVIQGRYVALLHSAIADDRQGEIVDAILEVKPDLQLVNQGLTPLMVAINAGLPGVVERLLRAGADPNSNPPGTGDPPLFHAANKTPAIVAALLKHGADPNFVNERGFTPLFGLGDPEILQLLLDHKADPNKGSNPLTELLRRRTSAPAPPPGIGLPARPSDYPAVELLLKGGANPNATFADGTRILTWTVSNRDGKLVDLLLKHGAEVNYVANNETPLSLAQRNARDPRSTSNNPRIIEEWEQIEKALREHGANEYLQRLSTISYTRPAWTGGESRAVFSRGTSDYNRHTLFEVLAAVFTGNDQPAFPELSRVTIERLEGASPKRKELAINIDELLRAGDCSKDTWLEWGDRISFPETDHPLNEGWAGLPQETFDLLTKCLTRRVSIVVKQETNVVKLVPSWGGVAGPIYNPNPLGFPGSPVPQPIRSIPNRPPRPIGLGGAAPAQEKSEKVLETFRLKEVVYGANVLRASSDPTRVRVTRREGDKTMEWTFDVTKIASASPRGVAIAYATSLPGGVPPQRPIEDLWLRDGDVIEVPEKP